MANTTERSAIRSTDVRPCPLCLKGLSMWDDDCQKCSECGREFDNSGSMIASARCEGDLDGWGTLC